MRCANCKRRTSKRLCVVVVPFHVAFAHAQAYNYERKLFAGFLRIRRVNCGAAWSNAFSNWAIHVHDWRHFLHFYFFHYSFIDLLICTGYGSGGGSASLVILFFLLVVLTSDMPAQIETTTATGLLSLWHEKHMISYFWKSNIDITDLTWQLLSFIVI